MQKVSNAGERTMVMASPGLPDDVSAPVPAPPVVETPWASLYPPEIFADNPAGAPVFWTCVRTRPRWEKKFAAFLRGRSWPHFLPLYAKDTHSGRKSRRSWLPLFPGYVFVQGQRSKSDLNGAAMVVRLLQPEGVHQICRLHAELRNIWQSLARGVSLLPAQELAVGELCEIVAGPLRGLHGRYERPGTQGRLVLQVDMLSMGAVVEVAGDQVQPLRA